MFYGQHGHLVVRGQAVRVQPAGVDQGLAGQLDFQQLK